MVGAAARTLLRRPSFTLAAAGTLALGIAATTTLFTMVNAALLRPLPYARPNDLYAIRTYFPDGRFTIGMVATEEMAAVAALTQSVARVALAVRVDGAIDTTTTPRQIVAYAVSDSFFEMFGVPVQAGRAIGGSDADRGAPRVAVLSQSLWRGAFGARPDIVGSLMTLSGRPVRVVGIAPAGFDVPAGTDLWTNLFAQPSIGHLYEGYLRARPGFSLPALQAQMNQTLVVLSTKYPDMERGRAYAVRPLLDATVGTLGPILVILFAATGLLLVLAIVNVTNLLLARTTTRTREIAVHAALGASRARIIAQLLTESLLIAAAGAATGTALAVGAIRALMRLGAAQLPRLGAPAIDVTVIVFVAVLAGLTGVLIGIVPALRMADTNISMLMNQTGRSVRGSRHTRRLLGAFVIVEVAAAVAIVAGAARLIRSYQNLEALDPGFDPRGRLVLDVTLPPPQMPVLERRNAWWDATEAALRGAGATEVAATSSLPLEPHEWDSTAFVDMVKHPDIPVDRRPNARLRLVTPDFFHTMGIRLLEGRTITRGDGIHTQPVGVVNRAFGTRNLGGASPIGEQIRGLHGHPVNGKFVDDYVQVVGVVRDVKYSTLSGPTEPVLYVPFSQFYAGRVAIVITSADGTPERHAAEFEAALRRVEPRLAIEARSVPSVVAASLNRERLGMWLMVGFGLAALLLAAIGMFGVIAYVVSQRTGEMAVRQALGATRAQVLAAVMRDGVPSAAAGIALGGALAWWTGRLLAGYLFEVAPRDPIVLGGSAAIVAVLVIAATLLPARRAATLELARALRTD
jgi:putative ABC transport system permease protein